MEVLLGVREMYQEISQNSQGGTVCSLFWNDMWFSPTQQGWTLKSYLWWWKGVVQGWE